MIEEISNNKILPVPWIKVETKIDKTILFGKEENRVINNETYHSSIFSLLPYIKIKRKYNITPTKRGYYKMNTLSLTCGDFFSVGKINYLDLEVDANLLVYPELVPLKEITLPSHSWKGDIIVRRWIMEDPFMIRGIRPYDYNDAMKGISWLATAKTGELQVNQYDFTADSHLMILLNVDIRSGQWEETENKDIIEKGISYGASIANYSLSQGINTGFGTNGQVVEGDNYFYIKPRGNRNQLLYIYETMAKLKIKRQITFHTLLEEENKKNTYNMDYLLITAYLDERMQLEIDNLRLKGNTVEILYV
ncbi:DUF58 domain-containing protein [Natranaerovirga hydrolytica]|nr:DUF58 domain-containing protein [Natranaerovirga hydrolytica]